MKTRTLADRQQWIGFAPLKMLLTRHRLMFEAADFPLLMPLPSKSVTASDYVPTYPNLLLASEGASTDAIQDSSPNRSLGDTLP